MELTVDEMLRKVLGYGIGAGGRNEKLYTKRLQDPKKGDRKTSFFQRIDPEIRIFFSKIGNIIHSVVKLVRTSDVGVEIFLQSFR